MKKRKKEKKISSTIIYVLTLLLVLLDLILYYGLNWIIDNIGYVSIDEVIFHLKVPLEGTSHRMIDDVIMRCFVPPIIILIIIIVLFQIPYKKTSEFTIKIFKKQFVTDLKSIMKKIMLIVAIVVFINKLNDINHKFEVTKYIKQQFKNSKFIKENYVDPSKVDVTFEDEKRNLIYIYLESMESTYTDKENGGSQEQNIIPELTDLAYDYINFSDNDKIGGAYPIYGTTWTIGGMVAQTAGIPLTIPVHGNAYVGYNEFLPGSYTLGDILDKNGYNQMLMVGSNIKFGGRDTYFKQHGNYKLKDLYTARKEKIVGKNYYVFWGLEDSKLFNYAKDEITKMSNKDKPFNFTMLTVNTHFPDGYVEKECDIDTGNNYADSITCSSKQVYDFVKWIQDQDFYDNTTIIISGDHLSMADNEIFSVGYDKRRIYNVIINSALEDNNTKNRKFTSFDMYPTTLASLGANIKGNRLGLGTNLYSDKKTIVEKYDVKYVDEELRKKSDFYNNNILYKR